MRKKNHINPRLVALGVLERVIKSHQNLDVVLRETLDKTESNASFVSELCYGVVRWHLLLEKVISSLSHKKIKNKNLDVQIIIELGLYQLYYLRLPDYAAISETVNLCSLIGKSWAKAWVNATLRTSQKKFTSLDQLLKNNTMQHAHPTWLAQRIENAWPKESLEIFQANNKHPPFYIRINSQVVSTTDYLDKLQAIEINAKIYGSGLSLLLSEAIDVERLPGFKEGYASVQDYSAQLAAPLLSAKADEYVLDACSAPGGKSSHLLELAPQCHLTCLDASKNRLVRVRENLKRLNQTADLKVAKAECPDDWWDGRLYDKILIDAPCSGTGVIRRHPDIKILRNEEQIIRIAQLQANLIKNLWPLLQPGGLLLYTTCSILPEENHHIIEQFFSNRTDYDSQEIPADYGIQMAFGRQRLPGIHPGDGFYYCLIKKKR